MKLQQSQEIRQTDITHCPLHRGLACSIAKSVAIPSAVLFVCFEIVINGLQARIFLLVDLRGFFSDLGSGGDEKKINKKALKMTSQLVIFRAFFSVKLVRQTNSVLVCFVALRPKSTAMVIAGRSVHLTSLFPGQAGSSG